MLTMVDYVHQRVLSYSSCRVAVDMTMGNGHDTAFLMTCCDEVYAFDIQEKALENTKKRIGDAKHVHLILDGHENVDHYLTSFDIGIFNLGYLPLEDHVITTLLPTTKIAIEKAISMFKKALFIVVYPGHQEGYKESEWIDEYVSSLDTHMYNVSCYRMLNKNKSPYVIEIERR